MKKIAIIPTLLTLGNAVCGLAAMACASKIGGAGSSPDRDSYFFALSGWLIIAAMIFDALDGYVARLSKTASDFGLQLDSLCDAISFGAAPAILLLRLGPPWERVQRLHEALAVIAALYMVCAILRLARFNIEATLEPARSEVRGQGSGPRGQGSEVKGKRFRGLPSPGAAGCIASLAILRGSEQYQKWPALRPELAQNVIEIWATLGALTVALLMVSRVPYSHLTKQILRGRRPFRHVVQVIIAVSVIVLIWELALVLLFWAYALLMPLRYVWAKALHRAAAPPLTGWDDPAPR